MIVLDASAAIALLLRTNQSHSIEERVFAPDERVHAPALVDLEIVQVLCRFVRSGAMSSERARESLDVWTGLPVRRHGHDALLDRIWALRENLTAYDAAYVALAEALDAPLLTCDAKLVVTGGHAARIEMVGAA